MAVDHVERLVIGGDRDAVGPIDFLLSQHAGYLAGLIDAINAFHVHFQVAAVGAIAGIGEPGAALAIDHDIVGAVVALAVVLFREHLNLAGLHIGADDAPPPRSLLPALAAYEPALGIEKITIGSAAVGTEDRY